MLKLVIDIGNTVTKIAVFDDDELIEFYTVYDNPAIKVKEILISFPEIKSSILSTVAGISTSLKKILQSTGTFIELDNNTSVPFVNLYETPDTLGKDRIAIAVAAVSKFPCNNVLVIDVGTCITYDFINSNSEYLGGAISPGFALRFKSLYEFTHSLPLLKLPDTDKEIKLTGATTHESIFSGVIYGVKSEVEHIINQYKSLYPQLKVIISGGDHNYFDSLVKNDIFAAPNIVVYGLKKILDFNEKN